MSDVTSHNRGAGLSPRKVPPPSTCNDSPRGHQLPLFASDICQLSEDSLKQFLCPSHTRKGPWNVFVWEQCRKERK